MDIQENPESKKQIKPIGLEVNTKCTLVDQEEQFRLEKIRREEELKRREEELKRREELEIRKQQEEAARQKELERRRKRFVD